MTTPSLLCSRIAWRLSSSPTAPKSSPGPKEVQYTLGPRPNSTVRPVRGPPRTHGTISASLETSPLRSPAAHHISASLEGRKLTLRKQAFSASFETPSIEPSAGPRLEGKTPPRSRLPLDRRNKQPICSPTQLIEALNANHSATRRGSQAVSGRHAAQRE